MYEAGVQQRDIFKHIVQTLSKSEHIDKNFEYKKFTVKFITDNYSQSFASPDTSDSSTEKKLLKPHKTQRINGKYFTPSQSEVDTTLWPTSWCLNLLLNMVSGQSDGLLKVLVDTSESDDNSNGSGIFDTNSKILILSMWLNGNTEPFKIDHTLKTYLRNLRKNLKTSCDAQVHEIIDTILNSSSDYFDIGFFKRNGLQDVIDVIKNFRCAIWFRNFSDSSCVMSLYRTLASVGVVQSPLHLLQSRFQSEFMRDVFSDTKANYNTKFVLENNNLKEPIFCNTNLIQKDFLYKRQQKINSSNGYEAFDFYYHVLLALYFVEIDKKTKCPTFNYKSYYKKDDKTHKRKYHLLYKPDGKSTLRVIDSIFDELNSYKQNDLEGYSEFVKEWYDVCINLNRLFRYANKHKTTFRKLGGASEGSLAKLLKDNYADYNPSSTNSLQKLYNFGIDGSAPFLTILLNIYRYIQNTPKVHFNKHEDLIMKLYIKNYISSFEDFITNESYSNNYLFSTDITRWRESDNTNINKPLPSILTVLSDLKSEFGTDYFCFFQEQLFKNIISDNISKNDRIKNIATNTKVRDVVYDSLEKLEIPYENEETIWITAYGPVKVSVPQTDDEYAMMGHMLESSKGGDILHDVSTNKICALIERRDANCEFEKYKTKNYENHWKCVMCIQNKNFNAAWNAMIEYPAAMQKYQYFESKYDKTELTPLDKCNDHLEKLYLDFKWCEYYRNNLKKFVNNTLIGLEYDDDITNPLQYQYIVKEIKPQLV
jgi:hypothetical protein